MSEETENTRADKIGSLSAYLNAFMGSLGTASLSLAASERQALAYTPAETALAQKLGEDYIAAATAEPYDVEAFIRARDALILQNAGYLDRVLPAFETLIGKDAVEQRLFYYTDDGQPRESALEALREMNLPRLQAVFDAVAARGKAPETAPAKRPAPKGPR